MSLKLSSRSVAEELVYREKNADQMLEHAEQTGDAKLAHEAEMQQQVNAGVREGIRETRTSLSSISTIIAGTETHGNMVTMGVYVPSNDTIGVSFEALTQTVSGSISRVRYEAAKTFSGTVRHEERHQRSLTSAETKGQAGLVAEHFGMETFVDVQETMARKNTTKGIDAYDAHEARVHRLASEIGMTLSELVDNVEEGEEAALVRAGYESGYLDAA